MNDADVVRLVDAIEDSAAGYVTLDQLQAAAGEDLAGPVARGLLLVDHRTRLDGTPTTLCRLNRHHPLVIQLTSW
ncbi:MAG: hypothetical protein M3069_18585 [Chloroflexota bacterium]|nr:hypothetical protein [Chloroflexota bacterium]